MMRGIAMVPRCALRVFSTGALSSAFSTGLPSSTTSRIPPHQTYTVSGIEFTQRRNTGSRRWLSQEAHRRRSTGHRRRTMPSRELGNSPTDEPSTSNIYSEMELCPGPEMLSRITTDLEASGTKFIVPLANQDVVEEMIQPFRKLIQLGARPESLIEACTSKAEFFKALITKGESTVSILACISEMCGLSYEDSIRLFSSYIDELHKVGNISVQERIDVLVSSGVQAGKAIGRIVRQCPGLLFAREPHDLQRAIAVLNDFFSRKQISAILQKSPEVLMKSEENIRERYEYIYFQMCVNGEEIMKSSGWTRLSLEEIIQRHEFLMKCGRYRTPDPKRPQENPELHQILDVGEQQFATQVAQVSREEWLVYQTLTVKEAESANKGRRFERIKPSMRRAYERRKKESLEKQEHIFDASTDQD